MPGNISFNSISSSKVPPSWPRGLLTFVFIIFLLIGGATIGVRFWNQQQQLKVDALDQELQSLRESFPSDQQQKVALLEKKLNILQQLLAHHIYFSQDLATLESLTHPQIYYKNLIFSPTENSLSLQGVAKNQTVLSEALSGFTNNPQKVRMVVFHQSKTNSDGSIEFSLDLYLQPSILNYQSPTNISQESNLPLNQ